MIMHVHVILLVIPKLSMRPRILNLEVIGIIAHVPIAGRPDHNRCISRLSDNVSAVSGRPRIGPATSIGGSGEKTEKYNQVFHG